MACIDYKDLVLSLFFLHWKFVHFWNKKKLLPTLKSRWVLLEKKYIVLLISSQFHSFLKNTGVALVPRESLQEVYDGVWGYSAILSSGAIMCVFFAFNGMSFLLGMMNLANTIIIQYALRTTMSIEVSRYNNVINHKLPEVLLRSDAPSKPNLFDLVRRNTLS